VEWENLSGRFFVGGEVPLEVTVERRVEVPSVRRGRIMLQDN